MRTNSTNLQLIRNYTKQSMVLEWCPALLLVLLQHPLQAAKCRRRVALQCRELLFLPPQVVGSQLVSEATLTVITVSYVTSYYQCVAEQHKPAFSIHKLSRAH